MSFVRDVNPHFDVAVIGAGVVGSAIARRLTLDGARVAVFEKSAELLDGASKGNSAILHTGFDSPTGSLEQSCIARGYQEFLDIRHQLELPVLETGAMLLAWNEAQNEQLEGLIERAHANGVSNVRRLSGKEILKKEPHLNSKVSGGFEIPGEYLLDPWSTPQAYLRQALNNGAQLFRNTEVLAGSFAAGQWQLETSSGKFRAGLVINCAGLYGDIVNQRLIGESLFSIKPRKGQFIVYDKAASLYLNSTILPVPGINTKGILVCRTIFGNVLVGPTAEDQDSRDDNSSDMETVKYLHEKGKEILPNLAKCKVTATYAGLRPATEFSDYQIERKQSQHFICVGGIRSTGLSSALGIASHVSELSASLFSGTAIAAPVTASSNRLSEYHPRDWQQPGNGGIVCHCELVTHREIRQALEGELAPTTLAGLTRQTRVCMGRCQGFYCQDKVAVIVKDYYGPSLSLVDDS